MKKRKRFIQRLVVFLSALATVSIVAIMLLIVGVILVKGIGALSPGMIFRAPKGGYYFGGEGGILNAILGSLSLAGGASLLAILLGTPAALFLNVYLSRHRGVQHAIRFVLDALWGVPSIVYGAFGFALMTYLGMRASLGAGILTLALLITPILIRSFDEVLQTVPRGLYEAAYSLGSSRRQTAFQVVFRRAFPGFVTAVLLAFGRGIGDAASVLFTAGYTDLLPSGLNEPVATMPLAIFFQLGSPIPEVRERAFAAAFVLTVLILFISVGTRLAFRNRDSIHTKT